MKDKYITQVIPLVRLPISRTQVFSYLSNETVERGSLVEIPFYNRLIGGIVVESRNYFEHTANFRLKKIKKVVEKSILSEKQIQFAEELAKYYLSPLGIVLRSMIPKSVGLKKQKSVYRSSKLEIVTGSKLAEELAARKDAKIALIGRKDKRDETILSTINSILQKKKSCLCLCSEIFSAESFFEKLKKYFPSSVIELLHSNISKGEAYNLWKKVKSGEVKIVVSTKIGVFLPFCNLSAVVVEEPGDISHKQWDMSPRYNAVQAAEILAGVHGAKMFFSSSIPSVEIWKAARDKKLKLVDFGMNKDKSVKIVNIFKERKDFNFPIGKELHQLLSRALHKREKALLVVNRRGFSSYSICRACKKILRCPNCDRALVYFEEKEKYRCLHCSYRTDLLSVCPACGSFQFSHQGIGIQLVEKKLRGLFPMTRILRIDVDIPTSKKKNEKIFQELASENFDILIGTQIVLKVEVPQKFSLLVFPDFDNLKGISDFNSRELIFGMLGQAFDSASDKGTLLIQTNYSDDFLLDVFQNQNYETFFKKELAERKKTENPQFSRLVKIFYRNKNKKKVDSETKKVFNLLVGLSGSKIDISSPYEPFATKKRGYYHKNILIKTKPDADLRSLPIFPILGGLKKGWAVDVDPINTV